MGYYKNFLPVISNIKYINFKRYIFWSFIVIVICIIFYIFIDLNLTKFLHSSLQDSYVKDFFVYITDFGKSEYYLIPSLILFIYFFKRDVNIAKRSIFVLLSVVVSGLFTRILKIVLGRARPVEFFDHNIYALKWFSLSHNFNSMPSGHATTALAAWVALALLFPKAKYIFIPIGVILAFSRLITFSHYLSDILAGALIGTLSSLILFYLYFGENINSIDKIKIS